MSTASERHALTPWHAVTAILAVVGVATLVTIIICRYRACRVVDPLVEADKRISDLEQSLCRLQDTFGKISTN